MRIVDGDIFSAMKLMLPEHKDEMRRIAQDRRKRKPPEVDESQLAEMDYVISEALELGKRVRFTLFAPIEDEVIEGYPIVEGGLLYVQTGSDKKRVEAGQLLNVVVIE